MKSFVVFDDIFDTTLLPVNGEAAFVFPLTADWQVINAVVDWLGKDGNSVALLPAAEMIDREAESRRDAFIEWSAAIGNVPVGAGNLRQCMQLPGETLSVWWLGLLADKDPVKNPVFLRIVQTGAILSAIENSGARIVFLALKDGVFREKLLKIMLKRGIDCRILPIKTENSGFGNHFRQIARKMPIVYSLQKFVRRVLDVYVIRKELPALNNRRTVFEDALLFFTYFPAVVADDTGKGTFHNRYALPLQKLCREHGKPLVWIASYADLDGYSLKDAVKLGRSFIEHGDHLFFYQEFLTAKRLWRVFATYLRTVLFWRGTRKSLNMARFKDICGVDYAGPFFLDALDESFYGFHLVNGLVQYEAFKGLFEHLKGFTHGVYYCEMMAWEYALNAAKQSNGVAFPLIAYQHSVVSRNYLQMFHSKVELAEKNRPAGIPFPEILASNGPTATRILSRYYDDITTLEAVRYLYLNDLLEKSHRLGRSAKNAATVLLICTNIELKESVTLVKLAALAFADDETGVEIWLKAHPALPVAQVLDAADIGCCRDAFIIKEGTVSDFLSQSHAVLVGASTVAVEALAFGCEVLVYVNAETLNQSPLIGYEEQYTKIFDPKGLKSALLRCNTSPVPECIAQKRQVASDFWSLDPSLDAWKTIMGLQ